jgi:hypothetical protein
LNTWLSLVVEVATLAALEVVAQEVLGPEQD